MARFREVLFTKNFFPLWAGQIISEFGDRLNQMALIALIYHRAPGSAMALAKLLLFIVVPVFVIGPIAGVYVDRWDRKKVMVLSDIFRGVMVLIVPIFIWLDMMVPIYVLVFLIFSATRFFLPSKMAIIPAIVSRDELVMANSLSNTTRMIATIFGFALAGFIVKWIGHLWGFYLDSISYFVSAMLISLITPEKKHQGAIREFRETKTMIRKSIRKNVWDEITEGLGYMLNKNKMKIVTSTLFLLMAGAGSIFCIIIVFIQEKFGSVTMDLGLMGVFLGIGLFSGTVVFGKLGQHLPEIRVIFVCFVLCGMMINLFALYSNGNPVFWVGGVLIMLVGALTAPIFICNNTLIHTLVPDEMRGRVFSSMEAVVHLAFLVFMFLTAYLAKSLPKVTILFVSGSVFAVIGIAGSIAWWRKDFSRNIQA